MKKALLLLCALLFAGLAACDDSSSSSSTTHPGDRVEDDSLGGGPGDDSTDTDPDSAEETGLVGTWEGADEAENMGAITITAVLDADGKLVRVVTLDATDDSLLRVDGAWRQESDRIISTNANCRMKDPMTRTWVAVGCDRFGGTVDTIRFAMPNSNTLLQIQDDSNPPDTIVFSRR